jgi:hypothetical protein
MSADTKYCDYLTQKIAKANNDDGIEHEYQELGREMQSYYPVKERGWMWSLFWKFPVHDIRIAHKKTVAQGVKSVRYLNAILRAPFKENNGVQVQSKS